jgi:hypothetical protein
MNGNPEFETAKATALQLLAYCRINDWAGFDPYDALNSRLFRVLPFLNFKMARLVLTQGIKRSPVNLRPLFLIPKTQNPKGIALFLSSLLKLSKLGLGGGDAAIKALTDNLLSLRLSGIRQSGWGYNFDWQTRGELVTKGSPNIICSTFAANALLDAYERSGESLLLETAVGTAEFIIKSFLSRGSGSKSCFRYTQVGPDEVHNANLLGAAFLCRTGRISGRTEFLDPALEATRFSVGKQHEDGSWDYGERAYQKWIDNFHTGFNLVALRVIGKFAETKEFELAARRGFEYYRTHFFREDGAPKYFNNSVYPIDIHSVAQSLITLTEFKEWAEDSPGLARSVLNWALTNMLDSQGYFYFQKHPHFTVRIPFMRWSQAWMLLALSTLLTEGYREPHD